jgi:protein ImuA
VSRHLKPSRDEVQERVRELRGHPGVFSFQHEAPAVKLAVHHEGSAPELGIRPGGVVEWLVARPGSGGVTSALEIMARSSGCRGIWAIVDRALECYFPALSGWGIDPGRILVLRPSSLREACWAIEQCLRCPGVSATWAWVDGKVPEQVHRRWQLAAEVGGGVGLFFRPISARGEPAWVDLRLLVTPQPGGQEETRRVCIETLYRRGGRGGSTQVWEIDHAEGHVRVVPQVAAPTAAKRTASA